MQDIEVPTVIIGSNMPPQLAAEVSSVLQELGVAVKANGWAAPQRVSRVIVVISPKGGSAKTAISSNLAVALAQRAPGRVVAVDLDVQFGDMESALSVAAERNLAQLARGSQIDVTTVKLSLTPSEHGLFVLAGAHDPVDAESIGHAHISAVLPVLAQNFDYVVVDTPAGLDERTLAAIECATDLLLVSSLDVTSIRSLRKAIDTLDQMGMQAQRQLVLNRADAHVGLDPSDAEAAIGMKISCSIPSTREVPLSLNLGVPVVVSDRKSAVAKQLQQLAQRFVPVEAETAREGVAAMSLAERINQAQQAAVQRGESVTKWRQAPDRPVTVDGLAQFKAQVHDALFERLGTRLFEATNEDQLQALVMVEIAALMDASETALSPDERQRLVGDIARDVMGLGPIEPFLDDPTVSEVMVNGSSHIYVERSGVIEQTDVRFISEEHLRRVVERIVSSVGRRIDEASPMVDARLADGSHVNVIVPPLSLDGSILTIRKFAKDPFTVKDLVAMGTLTDEVASVLSATVEGGMNVLVSGGTGTGKTTLLNVLSSFIPHNERIVTIEDAVELQLHQAHVIRLEARPENTEGQGQITIRDLVRNALRMRPDRIIVGEVRGAEALDMLQAMNTGHDGSLSTVHANAPRDALARVETMVLMAGFDLPTRAIREQIASALNLIVHVDRFRDGSRRLSHVTEVVGMEGDIITLQDIFKFDHQAMALLPTGVRPEFVDKLADRGVSLPAGLFGGHAMWQR